MSYRIDKECCITCGACESSCPVSCISAMDDGIRVIDEATCIDCGTCASVCPVSCISQV